MICIRVQESELHIQSTMPAVILIPENIKGTSQLIVSLVLLECSMWDLVYMWTMLRRSLKAKQCKIALTWRENISKCRLEAWRILLFRWCTTVITSYHCVLAIVFRTICGDSPHNPFTIPSSTFYNHNNAFLHRWHSWVEAAQRDFCAIGGLKEKQHKPMSQSLLKVNLTTHISPPCLEGFHSPLSSSLLDGVWTRKSPQWIEYIIDWQAWLIGAGTFPLQVRYWSKCPFKMNDFCSWWV